MAGFSRRRNGIVVAVATMVFAVLSAPAFADGAADERVRKLEARVAQLEALVEKQLAAASTNNSSRKIRRSGSPAGAPLNNRAAANATEPSPDNKDRSFNDLGQEAFIARDKVPTLKQRKIEISSEISYTNTAGTLQTERGVQMTNAIRYGVTDKLEASLIVPGYITQRNTRVGPSATASNVVTSLGDIILSSSYLLANQKPKWPGVTFSAGVIFPTGRSPYSFGATYVAGRNPIDVLKGIQSSAHWGVKADVQFFKTVDPVILFWGGGLEYLFTKHQDGHSISRGFRFSANAGMSMALSEKSTIASTLNFSYSPNFKVDGTTVSSSSTESINIRTTLIQRIGKSFYLEPSLTVGLSDNAADVVVGLGVRKRW